MLEKIALGTVQFGQNYGCANQVGQVLSNEVQRILSLAKEKRIGVVDTAISYGTSEEVLGKIGVDSFRIVTKLPPFPKDQSNIAGWVHEQVCGSLVRLKQKKIFGLLLHRSHDLLESYGERLAGVLTDLKATGIVEKIGVSIYSPEELDAVYKKIKINLVQAPLNVIDRRLQFSGWLDRLKDKDVEVHVRSVFLQGLLLMERGRIPAKFSPWSGLWDEWGYKLKIEDMSPLAACLSYPLSLEQVDQVVVGVDSAKQLQDIIAAVSDASLNNDTSFMISNDLRLINPSNWNKL
jgi:aryl-alcohol dehydrogenase-like predicted oxidoreductase